MRVLVVEDERHLAGPGRGLEAEGFAVDVALDGNDGLWRANEGDYDAHRPRHHVAGHDGYEVCSRSGEGGDWTPDPDADGAGRPELDEARALDTGADDFLAKPFSYVVLVARLRALLRRGSGSGRPCSGRRPRGSTRPPTGSGGARRDQPHAPAVLAARVPDARAGEVVSKADILEHVWDFAFEGDPNIVEVYIRQLRQRIDEPFGRNALQTVRLVGYRVVDDR